MKNVLGFRSGVLWKKILATIYYLYLGGTTMFLFSFAMDTSSIIDQLINLLDIVLPLLPFYFIPVIIGNAWGLRDKLPLFKNGKTVLGVVALIFIFYLPSTFVSKFHTAEYYQEKKLAQEQAKITQAKNAEEDRLKKEQAAKDAAKKAEADAKKAEEAKKSEEQKKIEAAQKKAEELRKAETDYKNSCQSYRYETIARRPNEYKGKNATFKGTVAQVLEEDGIDTVELLVVPYEGSDVLYVIYERKNKNESRILENDNIQLWGKLNGTITYQSSANTPVTVPQIEMKYYSIN